jgi:hypothetical protein
MNADPAQGVVLTVRSGAAAGQRFAFTERTTCIVGRASGCEPRLPPDDRRVSRHHCLLDINPPDVRIRDFGSLNGTFVNGEEIGRRQPGETPEEGYRTVFRERDLTDGDEVRVGRTVLDVQIPTAAKPGTSAYCAHCGRDVDQTEADQGRDGDIVCARCRADPAGVIHRLLALAPDDDDLAGLRGYEIVRELGHGSQGSVHLAQQVDTGELVALKVLLAQVAVSSAARSSFLGEIKNISALRHRNIVEFLADGSYGASFCLVCEYCEAGSLEHLLSARGGTLGPEEAVPIIRQVLDGLHHAHTAQPYGFVHGDIKPANVLLTGSGSHRAAKIGDFGLAKAFDLAGLSGLTRTGTSAGTVEYMPRAQLVDHKYARPDIDVWATAATLYRMLTGATPRDFPPSTDPVLVVLQEPAVPIRERNPAIPPRLAQVIDEALLEDPGPTFTAADTFKQALDDNT